MLDLYTPSLIRLLGDAAITGTFTISRGAGDWIAESTMSTPTAVAGSVIRMDTPRLGQTDPGWPIGNAPYLFLFAPGVDIQKNDQLTLSGDTWAITHVDADTFPGYVIAGASKL